VGRKAFPRGCAALTVVVLFALTLAGPAGAQPRNRSLSHAGSSGLAPVIGLDKPSAIEGRYIVVFDESTPAAAASVARVDARALGAKILHRSNHALDGFSATLSESAVEALRSNPHVAFIEADSRGPCVGHAVARDLGPGPDRPAQPSPVEQPYLQRHEGGCDRVHHRYGDPVLAHAIRGPGGHRIRLRRWRLGG
jgi:Peptidase inhibitor I9